MKKYRYKLRNDRGIALIIVLLVTALLITLIFEFAFGTRVSLRAAANYRDSQRAYFIAHSGFGVFARFPQLRDYIPQGELGTVPYVTEGDKVLQMKWEDESGKINVTKIGPIYSRLVNLFNIVQIDQNKLDQITSWSQTQKQDLHLITELHRFLSDEEYGKVAPFLTVSTGSNTNININTASSQVLQSLGLTAEEAQKIMESVQQDPYDPIKKPINTTTVPVTNPLLIIIIGQLTTSSNVFKVTSVATVGGYTKQIEAIMTLGSSGPLNYWRAI